MEKSKKLLSSFTIHHRQNLLTEKTRIASQFTVQNLKYLFQLESKINNQIISDADPSGRAVQGVGLRPLA
jgi:hypothetical protein